MSKYKTPDLLRRKRLRKYWLVFLTISFIASLIYGLSFWSRHDFFQISTINISGNKHVSTSLIQEIFNNAIKSKAFVVIDRNNFIFLPRSEIENQIEKELPVNVVYVKMPNIREVNIEVIEHTPVAVWCAQNIKTDCFLVNSNGLLFIKNTEPNSTDLIQLVGQIEGDPLGQYYVDEKTFNNFISIETLLKKINVGVSKITTDDHETFFFQTKNGPYLKVARYSDPEEVVNNLKTTLDQESIHEIQFNNIEYIDLRFEGRAYYKIK